MLCSTEVCKYSAFETNFCPRFLGEPANVNRERLFVAKFVYKQTQLNFRALYLAPTILLTELTKQIKYPCSNNLKL